MLELRLSIFLACSICSFTLDSSTCCTCCWGTFLSLGMVLEPPATYFSDSRIGWCCRVFFQAAILEMFFLLSEAFVVVSSLEHDVPTGLECCFFWFLLVSNIWIFYCWSWGLSLSLLSDLLVTLVLVPAAPFSWWYISLAAVDCMLFIIVCPIEWSSWCFGWEALTPLRSPVYSSVSLSNNFPLWITASPSIALCGVSNTLARAVGGTVCDLASKHVVWTILVAHKPVWVFVVSFYGWYP